MPTITDYLQQVVNGQNQPVVNAWVQLVNNATTTSYVSNAVTTGTGLFTVATVPAGTYTVNISTVSPTGPWTSTGNANYYIGADVGSANTFNATQSISGGSLTLSDNNSKIIPGANQLSLRNHSDSTDNALISDAGLMTVRNGIIVSSGGAAVTGNSTVTGTLTTTGEVSGTDFKATGTGQFSTQGRFLGVLPATGPPTSGTYTAGDYGFDTLGNLWFCGSGGSPGTWYPTSSVKFYKNMSFTGHPSAITVPSGFNNIWIRGGFYSSDTNSRFVTMILNNDNGARYYGMWTAVIFNSGAFSSGSQTAATSADIGVAIANNTGQNGSVNYVKINGTNAGASGGPSGMVINYTFEYGRFENSTTGTYVTGCGIYPVATPVPVTSITLDVTLGFGANSWVEMIGYV